MTLTVICPEVIMVKPLYNTWLSISLRFITARHLWDHKFKGHEWKSTNDIVKYNMVIIFYASDSCVLTALLDFFLAGRTGVETSLSILKTVSCDIVTDFFFFFLKKYYKRNIPLESSRWGRECWNVNEIKLWSALQSVIIRWLIISI